MYAARFSDREAAAKAGVWAEVVRYLAGSHLDLTGPVLDLACDRGYFIRFVVAPERWATDLRDVRVHLPADVTFVQADSLALAQRLPPEHFSTVFISNFLEHLPSGDAVIEQLRVVHHLLRPGGRAVILQPNIRLVGGAYWDFIDHKVPLSDRSLVEAAEIAGLRTRTVLTRFMPYTTKRHLPQHPLLVRAYLAFPPAWLILGRQTLYVGEAP